MMSATKEMLKTTKLHGLIVLEEDGIFYITSRVKQESYNPDKLVLLSPKHPITKLILRTLHEVDHRGVSHTLARSRIFYWIPQASKLLKKIKANCFKCRKLDKTAMKQMMAPLPAFRLKSSPIWHHSMIDLFGPISVRDFVNQRTTRKTWGVLITCLTTRACMAYAAASFSTDDLLAVLRKHESRNGSPAQYFADLGSQIVGADRVMTEAVHDLNKDTIEKFTNANGTKFTFGTPHHPAGQGAVERLVQEVKKCLRVLYNNNTMSFQELDTALAEASYLVNCRPLQLNPTTGDDGFICPNDLLMGRSSKEPVYEPFCDTNLTRRMAHIQRLKDEFWTKWSSSYYQQLVKYHKWRLAERNAQVGDVVLILDKEIAKGKFILGIIDSVKVDPDNLVRKVTVKYKLPQKGNTLELQPQVYKYAERNVRGLALIVTAEERRKNEEIQIDDSRQEATIEANDDETTNEDESNEDQESTFVPQPKLSDPVKIVEKEDAPKVDKGPTVDKIQLPPTSTGRTRFKPQILDL